MDEGYGGPVWQASAYPLNGNKTTYRAKLLACMNALHGVGCKADGQWTHIAASGSGMVCVLRRLSEAEAAAIAPVADIRGTPEAEQRLQKCKLVDPVDRRTSNAST